MFALLAQVTNQVTAELAAPAAVPGFLARFGLMLPPLLALGGTAVALIVERTLYYHRVQINAAEFFAGVKNVLKRDNVVEAISICDATPGPVARLVKAAIMAREGGRERIQEAVEDVALVEVPRLEARLNLLATIAQIGPLVGLFGTLWGFIGIFRDLQEAGSFAAPSELFRHLWMSLYSGAAGVAIAIVSYAAYNFLVSRVNAIVLDMEKTGGEVVRFISEPNGRNGSGPTAG